MRDFKKSSGFGKRSSGSRPSFGASRGPRSFGDQPTEMHQAMCNQCHKVCEVPFRPNGKKPVYCRDCFKEQEREGEPAAPRTFRREDTDARSSFRASDDAGPSTDLKKQFAVLNTKLDKLTAAIEAQTRQLASARE